MIKQRTLKDSVSAVGVGLHKGEKVRVTLRPAPANTGIVFRRVDLDPVVDIKATPEAVGETTLCTCLVNEEGVQISTVEHLLSAIAGIGIDNLIIDVDSPEIPIMDGSAFPFVEAINQVGIEEQDAEKDYFVVTENLTYEDTERQTEMLLVPQDEFRLTVMVDYNSPLLGTQHAHMYHHGEFESEISSSKNKYNSKMFP